MSVRRLGGARLLAVAACVAACGRPSPSVGEPSAPAAIGSSAHLSGEAVARVGDAELDRALILAVARAQSIVPRQAARALVDEALLAEAARSQGAASDPEVRTRGASALSRALVARYEAEARAQGPFTDDELAASMGSAWIELERPETRVVVHALIKAGTPDGAAIAERLRAALVDAPDPETFLSRATALPDVPKDALVAERIDSPFTDKGLVAVPGDGTTFDAVFARASFALGAVGDTSPVIETGFGFHVIRLVAIQPPFMATREQKLRRLEGEMIKARLGDRFSRWLADARAAANAQIVASDEELMLPKFGVDLGAGSSAPPDVSAP